MSIIDDAKKQVDDALRTVTDLEIYKAKVYLVTRTWSGSQPGDGTATDVKVLFTPVPQIKDFSVDLRLQEGGLVQQGDLLLKYIPKQTYPNENQVDCSKTVKNIEKFYMINDKLYVVISVVSEWTHWNVLIRKTKSQKTYFND